MEGFMLFKAAIAILLKLACIVIHSYGLYLLIYLQRNGKGNVQMVYITNLSLTELLINVISFLRNIFKLTPFATVDQQTFSEILQYTYIFDYAILRFCLNMSMIFITVDRLNLILLNTSYSLHWDIKKAKVIVVWTWLVSFCIYVTSTVVYSLNKDKTQYCLFANYLLITFDFTFLVIAVIAYSLIFRKFKEQTHLMNSSCTNIPNKVTIWSLFKQSRFYVALLLILTFTIFVIPPDIVWSLYICNHTIEYTRVKYVTTILYATSYLSDGLIYVFMNGKVKNLILERYRNSNIARNFYIKEEEVAVAV